jgi:hypothetical protein
MNINFTVFLSSNEGRLRKCISEQQTPLPNTAALPPRQETKESLDLAFTVFKMALFCSSNAAVYCDTNLKRLLNFIYTRVFIYIYRYGKGKAVPLQAWSGPECSRKLRFPDFMTTEQDDGKVVSLTHRPPLTPGNNTWYSFLLEADSTPGPLCDRKGYVTEKFQ